MKKYLLALGLLCAAPLAMAQELRVMTSNLRYDNPGDAPHDWPSRKKRVADMLRFYAPDVVGTQELMHHQTGELRMLLPGYTQVGVGREDGAQKGEYTAIYYRSDRYQELEKGHFWLSETPEQPGKGWDAACERIVTWVKLRDKMSRKSFVVLNIHFDHIGKKAREESVKLLLWRAREIAKGVPAIVLGDFNAEPDSQVYEDMQAGALLTDVRQIAQVKYGPEGTFHDFGKIELAKRPRIDYIFATGMPKVARYGVVADAWDGLQFSDHHAVVADLNYDQR